LSGTARLGRYAPAEQTSPEPHVGAATGLRDEQWE